MKKNLLISIVFITFTHCAISQATWQSAGFPVNGVGDSVIADVSTSTDLSGNTYFGGSFLQSISLGSTSLVHPFPSSSQNVLTSGFFYSKFNSNGKFIWAKSILSDSPGSNQCYIGPHNVDGEISCTDKNGNIYLTGSYNGDSLKVGSYKLTPYADKWFCKPLMFLAKCDTGGNVVWVKSGGGKGNTYASAHVDVSGNIFLLGSSTADTITLDGTMFAFPANMLKIFFAKFNASGTLQWIKPLFSQANYLNVINTCLDNYGNIFMSGLYTDTTVKIGTFTLTNPSPGNVTSFLMKCDNSGNVSWAKNTMGYYDNNMIGNIAVDQLGNVVLVGNFKATVTIDTITLTSTAAWYNTYVVKYNGVTGKAMWGITSQTQSASGLVIGNGIVNDKNGNCYLMGGFTCPNSTFGSFNLTRNGSYQNKFVAKITPGGSIQWVSTAYSGMCPMEKPTSVASDQDGNIYTLDWLAGPTINYPPIVIQNTVGFEKYVLAKLSITTGIDENAGDDAFFIIYPNPTQGEFTLMLKQQMPDASIKIYNTLGELVYNDQNVSAPKIDIELKGEAGIYFVQVTGKNKTWTSKIIKQ